MGTGTAMLGRRYQLWSAASVRRASGRTHARTDDDRRWPGPTAAIRIEEPRISRTTADIGAITSASWRFVANLVIATRRVVLVLQSFRRSVASELAVQPLSH